MQPSNPSPTTQAITSPKPATDPRVTHRTRTAQIIDEAQPVNIHIEYFSDDFTDQAITTTSAIVIELPTITDPIEKPEEPPEKDGD